MSLNEACQAQIMACVAKLINNRQIPSPVVIDVMIYQRKQMSSVTTYKAKNMCDSRELLIDRIQFIKNVRVMPCS